MLLGGCGKLECGTELEDVGHAFDRYFVPQLSLPPVPSPSLILSSLLCHVLLTAMMFQLTSGQN